MGKALPSDIQDALTTVLDLVERSEAFFNAGGFLGHTRLMQTDWLRMIDGLPATFEQAKCLATPMLLDVAESANRKYPIKWGHFSGASAFALAIAVGEFAITCRQLALAAAQLKRSESSGEINLDVERRTFADFVSKIRQGSVEEWGGIRPALEIEARRFARQRVESADNSKCPRPNRPNDPTTRELTIAVEDGLKAGMTVEQINKEFAGKHPQLNSAMLTTAKRGERRYRKAITEWERADK